MSISDADIQAAIATVGPLFDTPNAATGETGAEAAAAIEEAVAAVEGQTEEAAPAEEPQEESAPAPPKEDPVAKRMAMVAREKARVEAERAKIRSEREVIEQQRRAVEEYHARKARAKDDPFEFLKSETGLEFEDLARSIIAKAEPPKAPDPLEEARQVREQLEQLRQELAQREANARAEQATAGIKSELRGKLDEFPALKAAVTNPDVRETLQTMGVGDPEQRVVDTMVHVWRNGGQVEIDGRVYTWPRGTELPVDVAARIVDNEVMLLARRFAAVTGSQAMPTSASKVAQAAETSTPGKSATRPRTLSNTRASTPTSPLPRESRSYASDEDELRDLARRFDVWADGK